jgi:hypothetical protein
MLCILHELGLHRRPDGSLDTSSFKIVYVAPMKALVAEMVGNFTKRLGEAYGIHVRELTGEGGRVICSWLAGRRCGQGGVCVVTQLWLGRCGQRWCVC